MWLSQKMAEKLSEETHSAPPKGVVFQVKIKHSIKKQVDQNQKLVSKSGYLRPMIMIIDYYFNYHKGE